MFIWIILKNLAWICKECNFYRYWTIITCIYLIVKNHVPYCLATIEYLNIHEILKVLVVGENLISFKWVSLFFKCIGGNQNSFHEFHDLFRLLKISLNGIQQIVVIHHSHTFEITISRKKWLDGFVWIKIVTT